MDFFIFWKNMKKDGTVTAVSEKWFGRDISVIGK